MGKLDLASMAEIVVAVSWVYFWIVFGAMYFIVAIRRRRNGDDSGVRRVAHSARLGVILETLAIFCVFAGYRPIQQAPFWALAAGMALLPVSVALMHLALHALGRHWRIQAVVAESHQLVRVGPYAYLRHPVYAALLGMMIGTGLIWSSWAALAVAIAVYVAGTEIRVHAEESLLSAKFGRNFEEYRAGVRAYLPFLR